MCKFHHQILFSMKVAGFLKPHHPPKFATKKSASLFFFSKSESSVFWFLGKGHLSSFQKVTIKWWGNPWENRPSNTKPGLWSLKSLKIHCETCIGLPTLRKTGHDLEMVRQQLEQARTKKEIGITLALKCVRKQLCKDFFLEITKISIYIAYWAGSNFKGKKRLSILPEFFLKTRLTSAISESLR